MNIRLIQTVTKSSFFFKYRSICINNYVKLKNVDLFMRVQNYFSSNSLIKNYEENSLENIDSEKDSRKKVKFYVKILSKGITKEVEGKIGDSVMKASEEAGIGEYILVQTSTPIMEESEEKLEKRTLGACNGSCSCTTCHMYVDDEDYFESLEEPSTMEEDMLDKAKCLKENSRLTCQIIITEDTEGRVFSLPKFSTNFVVPG